MLLSEILAASQDFDVRMVYASQEVAASATTVGVMQLGVAFLIHAGPL